MKIDQYCQRQRWKHVELEQFWHAFASRRFVSDSLTFLFFTVTSFEYCAAGAWAEQRELCPRLADGEDNHCSADWPPAVTLPITDSTVWSRGMLTLHLVILYYCKWPQKACVFFVYNGLYVCKFFLAECRKRWLNQGSFVLLCFALFAFSGLCLVSVLSYFFIVFLACIFQPKPTWMALYSV